MEEAEVEEYFPIVLETLTLLNRVDACLALNEHTFAVLNWVTQAFHSTRFERKRQKFIKIGLHMF